MGTGTLLPANRTVPQSTLNVAHTPADVQTWPQILSQDVTRRG